MTRPSGRLGRAGVCHQRHGVPSEVVVCPQRLYRSQSWRTTSSCNDSIPLIRGTALYAIQGQEVRLGRAHDERSTEGRYGSPKQGSQYSPEDCAGCSQTAQAEGPSYSSTSATSSSETSISADEEQHLGARCASSSFTAASATYTNSGCIGDGGSDPPSSTECTNATEAADVQLEPPGVYCASRRLHRAAPHRAGANRSKAMPAMGRGGSSSSGAGPSNQPLPDFDEVVASAKDVIRKG